MTPPLLDILKMLSDAPGPSGNERAVRQALHPLIADHVDELRIDGMGNLITLKRGTGASDLRVLITAHMDEVGLMVTGHNSDGSLHVETIGGIDARLLPGLDVRVGEDQLPGVIGIQAIHRTTNQDKVTKLKQLAVDIGAGSEEEAQKLAPLGTVMTFATQSHPIGQCFAGKAFDDRAGCTTLVALLQGARLPFDIYGVFTVQEEVGLRGARVVAYALDPDAAFALEGTIADDLPKEEDVSPTSELGKGPVITVMDRSYISPPRLLHFAVEIAQTEGIPYQFKQPGIGGTDSGTIHFARGGVPTLTLAVPCRYIHSPISLLNPQDLEHTVALLRALLTHLTPAVLRPEE